jgi:hypothetical protein
VHRNLCCLAIVLSLLAPSIPVQPQTNISARPPEVQSSQPSAAHVVDLKAPDGTILKGELFCRSQTGSGCVAAASGQPDAPFLG